MTAHDRRVSPPRRVAWRAAFAAALLFLAGLPVAATEDVAKEPATPGAEEAERDSPRAPGSGADTPVLAPGSSIVERVHVTAAMPDVEDPAAFVTVLDARDLARRGAGLADLLRRVPGARVRDYGGLGRYATVSLRASTAEQVAVFVDGVPQNRALGGPVDLSSIPATHLERVTVFRGFGPAALGAGSVGGVVDVRTRRPGDGLAASVDLLAGELGTRRLSAGFGWSAGERATFRAGGETLRGDGDFIYLDTLGTPFEPSDDLLRRRQNNAVDGSALMFQGAIERAAGAALHFGLRGHSKSTGLPGNDARRSTHARLDEDLADFSAGYRAGDGGPRFDVLFDGFRHVLAFTDRDGELGVGSQDQRTQLSGAGASGIWRSSRAGRWLVRADVRHERARLTDDALQVRDRGGADRSSAGVTFETRGSRGRFSWIPAASLGFQRDDFIAGGDGTLPAPAADAERVFWTAKLGLSWALSSAHALRGSIGRFQRHPNLLEMFGDRGTVVGNPALAPETGWAAELGWAHERDTPAGRWSAAIVGFTRDVRDLILLRPNSQAVSVADNVSAARIHGVEGELAWNGATFAFDLGGTLRRSRNGSGGVGHGRRLVYQPDTLGYAGAEWRRGRMQARWEITYTGDNSVDELDTPALRMPSRWIHDANLRVELKRGLTAGIDVRNVFDRRVRDVAGYPLPDRVVLLHLGWSRDAAAVRR